MGSQDHHAVNERDDEQAPSKVLENEKKEKGSETQNDDPAEKRQPIFSRIKDIQAGEKLPENFSAGGNVQLLVPKISIRGWIQNLI